MLGHSVILHSGLHWQSWRSAETFWNSQSWEGCAPAGQFTGPWTATISAGFFEQNKKRWCSCCFALPKFRSFGCSTCSRCCPGCCKSSPGNHWSWPSGSFVPCKCLCVALQTEKRFGPPATYWAFYSDWYWPFNLTAWCSAESFPKNRCEESFKLHDLGSGPSKCLFSALNSYSSKGL